MLLEETANATNAYLSRCGDSAGQSLKGGHRGVHDTAWNTGTSWGAVAWGKDTVRAETERHPIRTRPTPPDNVHQQ